MRLMGLVFSFLFLSSNIFADPCNGKGKGGGNKCGITEEEAQTLIDDSLSDVNLDINETKTEVNDLSTSVNNISADVNSLNTSVEETQGQVKTLSSNVDSLNVSVDGLQSHARQTDRRLDRLEEAKWFLDTSVRVGSSQYLDVELYNQYDWRHSRNYAFGMKFIFKPGKSYEERLIEKQSKEILELKRMISELAAYNSLTVVVEESKEK